MKKLLIFGVALLVALALTFLFYKGRFVQKTQIHEVLVAQANMAKGDRLQLRNVIWQRISSTVLQPNYIIRRPGVDEKIIGARITANIKKGGKTAENAVGTGKGRFVCTDVASRHDCRCSALAKSCFNRAFNQEQ